MKYVLTALIIYAVIAGLMLFINLIRPTQALMGAVFIAVSYSFIVWADHSNQTTDTEIWSGKITKVEHIEEWDEWHPPREETYTTTDSKGNTVTHTRTIPGYWEHHEAENYITTSDDGTIRVYKTPDGKKFTDDFVNSTKELEEYYPVGAATASVHTFVNKVQASYSLFKNKDINLEDYPDLPDYPSKMNSYYSVDRLIGNFKDKAIKSRYLDEINSNLNDTKNPNNKEKVKSYKQVNLMLVNFGDKSEDYGYALQDHWENGAKNDVIVTFGTDKKGKPTWCYVFSWSDVEILKTDIREVIMSTEDINKEFNTALNKISDLIEEKYKRREFAEFEYIQIEPSNFCKVLLVIVFIAVCIMILFI